MTDPRWVNQQIKLARIYRCKEYVDGYIFGIRRFASYGKYGTEGLVENYRVNKDREFVEGMECGLSGKPAWVLN